MIIRCHRPDGTCTGYYYTQTIETFAPGTYAAPYVMFNDRKITAGTVEILTDHGELIQTLELTR